jgi:hypothetical protein
MRLNLDLPAVGECAARHCAYNVDSHCHARAITVGSRIHPACDTFLAADEHVHDVTASAVVGACKMSSCRYNDDLECHAGSIVLTGHDGHADCGTFQPA